MNAKEFQREKRRMLNAFGREYDTCGGICCIDCPFYFWPSCQINNESAVDIVGKWSAAHPKETLTFLSEIKMILPDTPMDGNSGMPRFCPQDIGFDNKIEHCNDCAACWNQEVSDGE